MELFESLMLGCLVAELLGGIGKTHWLLVWKCGTCDNSGRKLSFQTPIACWCSCGTAFDSVAWDRFPKQAFAQVK